MSLLQKPAAENKKRYHHRQERRADRIVDIIHNSTVVKEKLIKSAIPNRPSSQFHFCDTHGCTDTVVVGRRRS